MYQEEVVPIQEVIERFNVEKREQLEQRRAAFNRASEYEGRVLELMGRLPEKLPENIKELITERGEEYKLAREDLLEEFENPATIEIERAALEQQTFQKWLLSLPPDSNYKWIQFPVDYFQWSLDYPSPNGQTKVDYAPSAWPTVHDKEGDWECNQFTVELEAVESWIWQKSWESNSVMVRIGAIYEIPGSFIKTTGTLDVAPINKITGVVAAQSSTNPYGGTPFAAEVEIQEVIFAVGQSYASGGGFLGSRYRDVFREGGANTWFNKTISYNTWPKLYESKLSAPVVAGVPLLIYTWVDFSCEATGIPCGAFLKTNIETNGLLAMAH